MTVQQTAIATALEPWAASELAHPDAATDGLVAALDADPSLHAVWLTLSVLERGLPTDAEVRSAHRVLTGRGAAVLVAQLATDAASARRRHSRVDLLRSAVIVDVRHTAETDLATGIQRVARETVKRWHADHDIVLVTWTADGRSMRRLLPDEQATALHAAAPVHGPTAVADAVIVVPVGGTYLLPELAAEPWRTERVAALAEYGAVTSGVIGFDCVPLTTAETVGEGMPGAFARNLVAVSRMDRVGAISDAAAEEYSGWRRMLSGSGVKGPDVASVLLAAEAGSSTDADAREFADLVGLADDPLVLVVGSHEPRKNHLAVLQAAELAWREGLAFQLVFVGGNSWNSFGFTDTLAGLKKAGRNVATVSALPDRLLWAAYRLSRFTIFPSINEGFGLPVAESLASGTPVVTSRYGSMNQIGLAGGTIVVDPRDDDDLLRGMRSMIADTPLYERLRSEASAYRVRPWDDYASDLWDYFVD
ncbi:hypothetical protein GCM10027413_08940 [Conyzicola nivalis]|uniref:Glycosyl transferase family 1 domain-containing protein n=1 Tax=Conyzicola nivalis TaxID=1477021 RepID=A0A916WIK6_9MICO|nr:glycosyltransferase [Conyzicola nivalis]GGB03479.1 hypothetical protein GCM10010979_17690 [Conyzicola nivalis]